jgi:hypothetical protein
VWRVICGAVARVCWPPITRHSRDVPGTEQAYWILCCLFATIPLTAALHHALFYPHTCILDRFGADYTAPVLQAWLLRDPSLPWALAAAAVAHGAGRKSGMVRLLVAPVFISFVPLSLWVWDIPFTGRTICRHFHNGKLVLWGVPVTRRYFYAAGIATYLAFVGVLWFRRSRQPDREDHDGSAEAPP